VLAYIISGMRKTIAILGRQPALGLAELESLYGSEVMLAFGNSAALLDLEPNKIDFSRLGGTVRLAKVLIELETSSWSEVEKYLIENTPKQAESIEGKLSFGISAFGIKTSPKAVAKTALLVKKAIKNSGHSVRMVPHKATELGSAVVLYNKLAGPKGWEIIVVSDGKTTYLAQTANIQDINSYAARDQARPKRDAKVGMLPPKLAQIIVNLAVGQREVKRVLDPFCGTGVVLQEASLMGYDVVGTDIDSRMVEYSKDNLKWLKNEYPDLSNITNVSVADATRHTWKQPIDTVAAESFLGHPLSKLPAGEHLSKIIYEANVINHRFLINIAKQLAPGERICIGVPAWRGRHEFLHLPLLDHLTEMGYTRISFRNARDEDLIYHRENQVVGRELLVLEKN